MGNFIGRVIGIVLIAACWAVSVPLTDAWENHSRPKDTAIDSAPYNLSLYKTATVRKAWVEEKSDDLWSYRWDMTTTAPENEVLEYYRLMFPQGESAGEDENEIIFEVKPPDAEAGERIQYVVQPDLSGGKTEIAITEDVLKKGWNPSYGTRIWIVRVGLLGLMLLVLFILRAGLLAELLALVLPRFGRATGGHYQRLPAPPHHGPMLALWDAQRRHLEELEFVYAFDFQEHAEQGKSYARLLHRDGQIFAMLHYVMLLNPRAYVEFFSLFQDGSFTTSNSALAGDLDRPPHHPLRKVGAYLDMAAVLKAHEENIKSHRSQGHELVTVDPNKIFEVWNQVDQEVAAYRDQEGVISERALHRMQRGTYDDKKYEAVKGSDVALHIDNKGHDNRAVEAAPAMASQGVKTPDLPAFKSEVVQAVRLACPDATVTDRDELVIVVERGRYNEDIDLETAYYMVKRNPQDKDKIVEGIVHRVKSAST